VSDASEPPLCDTLGCENTPVEAGYCEECTGISPGVLDQDWGEESHQGSAGSLDVGDLDSNVPKSSDGAVDHPSEIEIDDE